MRWKADVACAVKDPTATGNARIALTNSVDMPSVLGIGSGYLGFLLGNSDQFFAMGSIPNGSKYPRTDTFSVGQGRQGLICSRTRYTQ